MMDFTLNDLQMLIEDLINTHGEEILDKQIYTSSDYGDRCHTTQLVRFNDLQLHDPKETSYSDTGKCVTENTESENVSDDNTVLVLT